MDFHFQLFEASTMVVSQEAKKAYINKYYEQGVCREIFWLLSFVYFLVRWHTSEVSLPPGDVIFAQLACTLNDVIVLFTLGITNLSF
jgi:hypothetical protein